MYKLVDRYRDADLLPEMASWVDSLNPSREGQWSSHDRSDEVTALFQPALQGIFPGRWRYAFVNLLNPMAVLHPHADGALPAGVERFHLVLSTNEFAWCWQDEWQQLDAGGIYSLDPSLLHYAVNLGDKPRIHFIVDMEVS